MTDLRFAELPVPVMTALRDGDLDTARALTGLPMTAYFVTGEARALWRFRLAQLVRSPGDAPWIVRAAVTEPGGEVVGHAGFHAAPDEHGTVTVAYSVDPAHRRRGYARAMLAALIDRAAADPAVRVVRATIAPGNAASLATIAGFGFAQAGEQWDEEDGLELVFDLPV
ncbi:GNAT family N-acetyltransferase [Actinomadura roseirufa]|uniref:GNAT family N-acetyltransferase n=1 Tax=Actinomadura roseirufa TaxID=2094049 RepID=UPI001A954A67|nr:GNAT family protein [Actinomadura roseirufa]